LVTKYFCDLCNSELGRDRTDITVHAEKEYTFHLCSTCTSNVSLADLIANLVTRHAHLEQETLINTGHPLMKITISPSFSLNRTIEEKLGYELGRQVLSFKK